MSSSTATSKPSVSNEKAADAVVAALIAAGLEVVFGLPGEENLPMVTALERARIPIVVCRHEQHAGFMAVANSRLTGGLAACLVTLGPGATNIFTPMAQAHLLGVPLLVITGQKALVDNDEGPFQVIDVVGSAGPLTALATSVADPELAGVRAMAAANMAMQRRDAVLLELPEDVADSPIDPAHLPPANPLRPPVTVAGPSALDRVAALIESADRPIILAGIGATSEPASRAIRRLAEATGIGVVATQMGKGALDERHPSAIASLGMHRSDYSHLVFDHTDLIVTVGYQPVEHPPRSWNQLDRPIIHVDHRPAAVEDRYLPSAELVGDIDHSLDGLLHLMAPIDTDWSDRVRATVSACLNQERADCESKQRSPDEPLLPLTVVGHVQDAVSAWSDDEADSTTVSLDNGLYKIWFARHFRAAGPHTLLLDNATASMGAGLAGGMEAARLGRRAMVVTGDGGFMMNVGDLQTACRLGLTMTVVVVRDDAYGFIGWHQEEQGRQRQDVDLGNPDLVLLARSFGAAGRRVGEDGSLPELLLSAGRSQGVTLIDCPIAYDATAVLESEDLLETARRQLAANQKFPTQEPCR